MYIAMTPLSDPAVLAGVAAITTMLTTVMTSWLAKSKGRQDIFQTELNSMRAEVDRLREDLAQRDTDARSNHDEIMSLRNQVAELHAQMLTLSHGIHVLTTQLRAADITPEFVPVDTSKTTGTLEGIEFT